MYDPLRGTLTEDKRKELFALLSIDGKSDALIRVEELDSTIVLNGEGDYGEVKDIGKTTNLHALIDSAMIKEMEKRGEKLSDWARHALRHRTQP